MHIFLLIAVFKRKNYKNKFIIKFIIIIINLVSFNHCLIKDIKKLNS